MTRTPFLALSLLVGLSISCGDTPTAVQDDAVQSAVEFSPELRVVGKGNGAEVSWDSFGFVIEGCDWGETVFVEGFFHTVVKVSKPDHRNIQYVFHLNAKAVGFGPVSGSKYVWSDRESFQFRENGAREGFKASLHSRLIGQGGATNMEFFGNVTFFHNANGDVTVDFDDFRQVCK